ncbi:stage II sporulation protein M [Ornithinimicrobium humiphilum]|uniref:Putative membrane protein SpoIIM required for sporulation n=1 Tax=Ornithinimicrobium humiphilum TaxID=125288 RepID=A0A543KQR4_9MICO|nr:stage II sporulation protein M [Ornithinimicrobium humiphilum]TQM97422.1 putative membrane protein SpoIIM required for sporulation [Ornithinimicrobium humiphilum]
MDLDALVGRRRGAWERLDQLARRRRLTGAEADELLDGYQRTATDLSAVRSAAPDATVVSYLSTLLARARGRASRVPTLSWSAVGRFLAEDFPAALYRLRWWWGITALANVVVGLLLGWWLTQNPVVENSLLSPEQVQLLVDVQFESYYSEHAASSFSTLVWVNNAWVAARCIGMGVLGVPVVWLLWQNIANVAVIGSLMHRHGRAEVFWGLLTPHGLLELMAIFVAAGVGLRLFWAWVAPGPRTRLANLAAEGRTAAGVSLGLVLVLLVSGVIEGFVTPSPLPTWARVGIGVLALLFFFVYVFTLGRRAVRAGATGDVGEELQAASAPSRA